MSDRPNPFERCSWEEIPGEVPDERGRRRVQCWRCGFTTAPTNKPLHKIHRQMPCDQRAVEAYAILRAGLARRRRDRREAQPPQPPAPQENLPGASAQKPPSLLGKVVSLCAAVKEWKNAGKPVRTEAEILQIYDAHCGPCEHRTENSKCDWCGCPVNKKTGPLTNMIAMGTKHCPDTPPRW